MRILVLEDDLGISRLMRLHFNDVGWHMDHATTGSEGLRLALRNNYDVMVFDNILPHYSGPQVCEQLRTYKITTPIIILSAVNDPSSKISSLNIGADDYIDKPFAFEELIARIKAVRRRRMTEETLPEPTCPKLIYDTKQQLLYCGDRQAQLTEKEGVLFDYLMQRTNSVCTQKELMSVLQPQKRVTGSNIVAAHIKSIRKKINPLDSLYHIVTITGSGYMLKCDSLV